MFTSRNAHLWVPGAVVGGLLLRECVHTYRYIFFAVLHHDKTRRGLDHDHPSVNQLHMRAAGVAGALGVGVPSYLGSAWVLERALRPSVPDPTVLFDAPPPPRLTLGVLARALSPRAATPASLRAFSSVHGAQLLAKAFAFGWSFLVLAPAAQAAAMAHFAYERSHEEQRASAYGRAYRRDTEEVVDLLGGSGGAGGVKARAAS